MPYAPQGVKETDGDDDDDDDDDDDVGVQFFSERCLLK
jgi:hypothetical protein